MKYSTQGNKCQFVILMVALCWLTNHLFALAKYFHFMYVLNFRLEA